MALGKGRPDTFRSASSTPHYQSFPTKPPKSRGKPPPSPESQRRLASSRNGLDRSNSSRSQRSSSKNESSPLPTKQLCVLAVIALAEQTAFNSISPYLPDMVSTFPDIADPSEIGIYVGLIASCFALAQFLTNFFWGWLSDRIGRKPVVLLCTLFTTAGFLAFGFCKTLWQAVLVQIFVGLVNGNQAIVSTCLGEITDRSNQSQAFAYLPVVYGIGAVTGPIVGGLLVEKRDPIKVMAGDGPMYPYLPPNIFASAILVVDIIIIALFMEESLDAAKQLPPLHKRVGTLFTWLWQFSTPNPTPSYTHPRQPSFSSLQQRRRHQSLPTIIDEEVPSDDDSDAESSHSTPILLPNTDEAHRLSAGDVLSKDTSLILVTYFVFQLSNIAYNSLYPIFAQASPPTGRDLSPREIGISLAFAGVVTIVFQVGIFTRMREKIGNKTTYRVGLAGFVVAFLLMPWVGYKDGKAGDGISLGRGKGALWAELAVVLIIKTVATVGGLTSALLLITNSAPDHSVLGTLNGLAQTLSAAGRAIGPFISGSLFTAATHVHPKGEAMAFGVFGGVAFVGFVLSFWITGKELEGGTWSGGEGSGDEEDEDEEEGDDGEDEQEGGEEEEEEEVLERAAQADERTPLVKGERAGR